MTNLTQNHITQIEELSGQVHTSLVSGSSDKELTKELSAIRWADYSLFVVSSSSFTNFDFVINTLMERRGDIIRCAATIILSDYLYSRRSFVARERFITQMTKELIENYLLSEYPGDYDIRKLESNAFGYAYLYHREGVNPVDETYLSYLSYQKEDFLHSSSQYSLLFV